MSLPDLLSGTGYAIRLTTVAGEDCSKNPTSIYPTYSLPSHELLTYTRKFGQLQLYITNCLVAINNNIPMLVIETHCTSSNLLVAKNTGEKFKLSLHQLIIFPLSEENYSRLIYCFRAQQPRNKVLEANYC